MPIQLAPVTTLDLHTIRDNFKKIADQAMDLQKVKDADYLTAGPVKDDLADKQSTFAEVGGNMYMYVRIGGNMFRVQLVAV